MKKIVKVKEFKEQYQGRFQNDSYETLEQWQIKNPKAKIIDTKINSKAYTTYENVLLVTYEELVPEVKEKK